MRRATCPPDGRTPKPRDRGNDRHIARGMRPGQGGVVVRKSRFVVALVLALALGVTAIAYADGTSQNDAFVDGKVTNKKKPKLSKKKSKKVQFNTGVRTETDTLEADGSHPDPAAEKISFGKNIKFKNGAAPVCTTVPAPGSTPAEARAACPGKSFLGSGGAKGFTAGRRRAGTEAG